LTLTGFVWWFDGFMVNSGVGQPGGGGRADRHAPWKTVGNRASRPLLTVRIGAERLASIGRTTRVLDFSFLIFFPRYGGERIRLPETGSTSEYACRNNES
jgi:hypothetical protein